MPISPQLSLLIIIAIGCTTFTTRVIPFLIFRKGKEIPVTVKYLGRVLPPAVIGMLLIYCLKTINPTTPPFALPEVLSIIVVVLLHIWKRNNLLSIGAGTILYMFLIQTIFV